MRTVDTGLRKGQGRNSGEGVRSRRGGKSAPVAVCKRLPKVSLSKALRSKGTVTKDGRGLKPVEAEVVKNYLSNGGNKAKAARDTLAAAGVSGGEDKLVEAFQKPEVQRAILVALETEGITDALIAKKIKEGLEATSVKTHEGIVVGEFTDYFARHKYLETALKVRGDMGEGMKVVAGNVQYQSFKSHDTDD